MAGIIEIVVLTQQPKSHLTGLPDLSGLINQLHYQFVDVHKIDKKIDVKQLQFGSKLDANSGKREEYFTVKEIISPELIRLNNDLIVRLLGVKQTPHPQRQK
jgi:site-specific DNA-methyltransferase (adenine-specific)